MLTPVLTISLGTILLLLVLHRRAENARMRQLRAEWTHAPERTRMMGLIAEYHRVCLAQDSVSGSLDDRTWSDLGMDDVFALLDRTQSTVGQQGLYHRLRTSPMVPNLGSFEHLIQYLGETDSVRERVQVALSRLRAPAGYHLCTLHEAAIEKRFWHLLLPMLGATMLSAVILVPFLPAALLVVAIGAVVLLSLRFLLASYISPTIAVFREVGPLIAAAEVIAELLSSEVVAAAEPLRRELPRLRRLRSLARLAGRGPAGNELIDSLMEYLNLLFLLDANALFFASRELRSRAASLHTVIRAVADVDAAIAIASFRAATDRWIQPRFLTHPASTILHDLRHPLIADPVPNSISLGPPNGVLLTGANMTGKSTFLRTVGVNVVLAQTINTCLASTYEGPIFHVRSLMGRTDDLLAGKSYYQVEVDSIVEILRSAETGEPFLLLFDELFRGTNTAERIAASAAVLRYLVPGGGHGNIIIAATHDGELVQLLRNTYAAYHLQDGFDAGGLRFDYRLREGPAVTRNAIALLRFSGAPESLVTVAESLAREFDSGLKS